MIKIKDDFYQKNNKQNVIENSIIHILLRLIENYTDEEQVEDVLIELRELNDDYFRDDVQETINVLSGKENICPICGGILIPSIEFISHPEIDGDFKEESFYYMCPECGFDDRDNC